MLTQRATSSLTLSLLFTFLMLTLTDTMKKTGKTVRFSNDITNIPEPKYLAEDLHLMRMSDFNMRRADRERMERLLSPLLTHSHREKIYRKIYGF